MSATAAPAGGPALVIGTRRYPVLLPRLSDPRLHLAAVIISLQVLGQVAVALDLGEDSGHLVRVPRLGDLLHDLGGVAWELGWVPLCVIRRHALQLLGLLGREGDLHVLRGSVVVGLRLR